MEYVEIGDLGSYIHEQKESNGIRITEGDARIVTKQLLEGLKIMHASNFFYAEHSRRLTLASPGKNYRLWCFKASNRRWLAFVDGGGHQELHAPL